MVLLYMVSIWLYIAVSEVMIRQLAATVARYNYNSEHIWRVWLLLWATVYFMNR